MVPSAAVVRTAIRLMRVVPVPLARGVALALGTIAWAALGDRRRTLLQTLAHTAPDHSPAQQRRLARRTFQKMASCVVDQFRLPSISPAELRALFEIRGLEHVDNAFALGKGVVLVSGHIGPYELAAACMAAEGYRVHGMVENLPPAVLEALAAYRAATGMGLVNMKDGVREAYRILAAGEAIILAADRAIGQARSAIEVPFAGGVRRVPTGPATFSMGTGAPIVIGFASLNPARRPRYLMEFDAPILPRGTGESERDRLTRLISDRIASFITAHPDEWFVFQPGWVTNGGS